MSGERFFMMCGTVVAVAFIISVGFGHCDMNSSTYLDKYKICMQYMKDTSKCDIESKALPSPSP